MYILYAKECNFSWQIENFSWAHSSCLSKIGYQIDFPITSLYRPQIGGPFNSSKLKDRNSCHILINKNHYKKLCLFVNFRILLVTKKHTHNLWERNFSNAHDICDTILQIGDADGLDCCDYGSITTTIQLCLVNLVSQGKFFHCILYVFSNVQ